MKVLLINGSPHKKGCTNRALEEVAAALEKNGVEAEILWLGAKAIGSCLGCNACGATGVCVQKDLVNDVAARLDTIDGLVVGSPVYYAGPNGQLTNFLDRLFYSSGHKLAGKPGAAVVSCRRAGSTASLDRLCKYFTISGMPVVSSSYWTMVHGMSAEEVEQDREGLQMMRVLGANMAWMLKCFEAGKEKGILFPGMQEQRVFTNFVR